MSYVYRLTDMGRWGIGNGGPLSSLQGDENTWYTDTRLLALEARPLPQPAIASFTVSGELFYVNFADSSTMGPYTLPVAEYSSPGDGLWAPDTAYTPLQTFSINGGFYVVLLEHTSASTFDPGANDGMGHDYYRLMFQAPGQTLPTGGAVGQRLAKTGSADYQIGYVWNFPTGSAGKFLRYRSSSPDDVEAETPDASELSFTNTGVSVLPTGTIENALNKLSDGTKIDVNGIPYDPPTGSGITATNVGDALDELGSSGSTAGKQTIWVPAASMSALLTDGAEPGTIETPSRKNLIKTMDFDSSSDEGAQFEIAMPKSWDGNEITFRVFWSHATTISTYGVAWNCYANSFAPNDAFDEIINNRVIVSDTGGVAETLYTTDVTDPLEVLNASSGLQPNFGEIVIFQIWRQTANTDDTLTIDARLHGVQIFYNTTAATDD